MSRALSRGPPLPHLRRDWAHRCHICTGAGLIAATSAPGLDSPLPHLHRDWAHRCHICTGAGLTATANGTAFCIQVDTPVCAECTKPAAPLVAFIEDDDALAAAQFHHPGAHAVPT